VLTKRTQSKDTIGFNIFLDHLIFSTAMTGNSELLVTGDKELFDLKKSNPRKSYLSESFEGN